MKTTKNRIVNNYNSFTKKKYLPIILLLYWFCLTLFVFIFGPYYYNIQSTYLFYGYLVSIHIALLFGYMRGQRSSGRKCRLVYNYYSVVKYCIYISTIYLTVKLFIMGGSELRNIRTTFINASLSYSANNPTNTSLFSYIDMLFVPIQSIALTNGIFCLKKIKKRQRILVIYIIIIIIGLSIGSATRSGIVQVAIILFAALMLGVYKKNYVIKRYQKILIVLTISLLIVLFFSYFSLLNMTRGGYSAINPLTQESPVNDNIFYKIFDSSMRPLINSVSFYMSHSYYRLNQALNLPFKGVGFGLSGSYFIMRNVISITGWKWLEDVSYGLRLDKELGSGYGLYWSTFYTWIASDFSFIGTIFIIYFIGYYFSLAMRDSLNYLNPFAVATFCNLFYFIFHFVFNNPLQDGSGITVYLGVPIIWLLLRKHQFSVRK